MLTFFTYHLCASEEIVPLYRVLRDSNSFQNENNFSAKQGSIGGHYCLKMYRVILPGFQFTVHHLCMFETFFMPAESIVAYVVIMYVIFVIDNAIYSAASLSYSKVKKHTIIWQICEFRLYTISYSGTETFLSSLVLALSSSARMKIKNKKYH